MRQLVSAAPVCAAAMYVVSGVALGLALVSGGDRRRPALYTCPDVMTKGKDSKSCALVARSALVGHGACQ